MHEKYRRLLSDTFLFAVGSFGTRLILFFLLPVYTYSLTAGEYGTLELANTLTSLAIPVLSGSIFNAVLRYGLDRTENAGDVLRNAWAVLGCGSVLTLVLTPLLKYSSLLGPYRWLLAGNILFGMAAQVFLTYLKATDRSRLFVLLGLLQTGLLALFNLLFLKGLRLGVPGCLLAGVLSAAITAVLAAALGRLWGELLRFSVNSELLGRMLRYSMPLIVSQMAWWIIEYSDKVMVDLFLGSEALGLYSVACKIPALLNVFIALFSQAWKLSAFREYGAEGQQAFCAGIFRVYTFAMALACSCLLVIVRPFLSMYVGQEFYGAWKFVPLLLLASVFSSVSVFMDAIYGALKKSVSDMMSTLLTGLMNIVLNLLLIPSLGIAGAALATAASYLFIAGYRLLDTRRYFRFPIHLPLLLTQLTVLGAAVFCVTRYSWGWLTALVAAAAVFLMNRKLVGRLWQYLPILCRKFPE